MAKCGGTVTSVSIFTAIIQRPKANNLRLGLTGEGSRPVFGPPKGAIGLESAIKQFPELETALHWDSSDSREKADNCQNT